MFVTKLQHGKTHLLIFRPTNCVAKSVINVLAKHLKTTGIHAIIPPLSPIT